MAARTRLDAHPASRNDEGERLDEEAPAVRRDVDPAGPEHSSTPPERVLADGVDDRVVGLAAPGEVVLQVVDDVVGAEGSHELDVPGAADAGDMGAEVLGELHCGGAERARRAVDDDPAPGSRVRQPQRRERLHRAIGHGRCLFEGEARRLERDRPTLAHADVLRVGAEVAGRAAEHHVADLELGHGAADGLDLAGQVDAERRPTRLPQPQRETPEHRRGGAGMGIGLRHGGRTHPDEDLVVLGRGAIDLRDPEHLRWPVAILDDGPHASPTVARRATTRRRAGTRARGGRARLYAAGVVPETRYARVDGLHLAYQIVGEEPIDLVLADQWTSHQEAQWDVPPVAELRRRLATIGRLITFDKRGVGMSDPVSIQSLPSIEAWVDDVRAVMDAARSDRAALITTLGGALMGLVFAATHPDRLRALIVVDGWARLREDRDYPIGLSPAEIDRRLEQTGSWLGSGRDARQLRAEHARLYPACVTPGRATSDSRRAPVSLWQ